MISYSRVQGIIVYNVCIFWNFLGVSSQFEYALSIKINKKFKGCKGQLI